jgi:hypothetical protein
MKTAWKTKQYAQRRMALVVIGVVLLLSGFGTLGRGNLFYQDWRGLNVFAPFAILIGLIALGFALVGFRNAETRN